MSLTRAMITSKLTNERGKRLVTLDWYEDADAAIDDPDKHALVLWLLRQAGKSQYLARLVITHLLTVRGGYIVFVSASEKQAAAIFHRKIRRPLERLLKAAQLKGEVRITNLSLEYLAMDSMCEVIAPNEDTNQGRSPTLLIFDEAKTIPDEVFLRLAPSCIGAGGKIVVASSAGKPDGFFYKLIQNLSPEVTLIHRQTNSNPCADQGVFNWLRKTFAFLSAASVHRELDNEFADDGDEFLPSALIDVAIDDGLGETIESTDEAFAFIDLSRKKDLTSRVVVTVQAARRPDVKNHLVVASIRVWDPKTSPTKEVDFAEVRADLLCLPDRFPNLRLVSVDEGAEAGSVLSWAKMQPTLSLKVHGFIATVNSNMDLWSALAARLHAQSISLPRHERLLAELRNLRQDSFAFGAKWRVVDGTKKLHRDVSLSLAGAVLAEAQHLRQEPLMFFSGGRLLSSVSDAATSVLQAVSAAGTALRQAVTTTTQALTPKPALPFRSTDELLRENLWPGDLSQEEKDRLAAHHAQVAQQQQRRAAREVEAIRRMGGAWFPDDPTPHGEFDQVLSEITQRFARWR